MGNKYIGIPNVQNTHTILPWLDDNKGDGRWGDGNIDLSFDHISGVKTKMLTMNMQLWGAYMALMWVNLEKYIVV